MMPAFRLVQAATPAEFAAARDLIEEYSAQTGASMGIDFCFEQLEAELDQLPRMYGPPAGCLLLVSRGDDWVGCGALRRFSQGVCEMKRLYVRPGARGAHLGRELVERLLSAARALGYERMVLDTVEKMIPARSLYRSLGFREIEPYYCNPMDGVSYMEFKFGTVAADVPRS